jgi:hypothetical protein
VIHMEKKNLEWLILRATSYRSPKEEKKSPQVQISKSGSDGSLLF